MRAAKVATLARTALRSRGMAAGTPSYTGTVYKESEKARENQFFSKQDEMALRKLLTKVKTSADAACSTAGAHSAKEEAALTSIVGKYKLDKKDMEGASCGPAACGMRRALLRCAALGPSPGFAYALTWLRCADALSPPHSADEVAPLDGLLSGRAVASRPGARAADCAQCEGNLTVRLHSLWRVSGRLGRQRGRQRGCQRSCHVRLRRGWPCG
jgi:hypothetical protein